MKKKDIVYLVLAAVILLAAGYIAYTYVLPHKSASSGIEVPTVGIMPSVFDDQELAGVRDTTKVLDFYQPIDLTTGLNNPAPFGH